jgi:hypothetical protein
MKANDFPRTVGRLGRKEVRQKDGEVTAVVYWLHGEGRHMEKYFPLRDTEFTVRALGSSQFRVMVGDEQFEDAGSPENIQAALISAFDHACIRAGIETASAKFKTTGQEENMVRPRQPSSSTVFNKLKTADQEDNLVRRRSPSSSHVFDRFKTAGQEENLVRKREESSSTAFDRFKTAGEEEDLNRRRR